jgi:putative nucleotide binding protein
MSDPDADAPDEGDGSGGSGGSDAGNGSDASDAADDDGPVAVLLDVLPNGRPDDDRPPSQKSPVAYGLGTDSFRLYELALDGDADVAVSDRVALDGPAVGRYNEVDYDDLTRNAAAEVEYAVESIVDADEERFVDFYNEAGPITLRLHQLNLLPGVGKQLRNNVLDERKRGPFERFEEVSERVSGLHRPREVIVDRIVEEVRKDDLKYRTFARREE